MLTLKKRKRGRQQQQKYYYGDLTNRSPLK